MPQGPFGRRVQESNELKIEYFDLERDGADDRFHPAHVVSVFLPLRHKHRLGIQLNRKLLRRATPRTSMAVFSFDLDPYLLKIAQEYWSVLRFAKLKYFDG